MKDIKRNLIDINSYNLILDFILAMNVVTYGTIIKTFRDERRFMKSFTNSIVTKADETPEIVDLNREFKERRLLREEVAKPMYKFISLMMKNIDRENRVICLNNINKLFVDVGRIRKYNAAKLKGCYKVYQNTIELQDNFTDNTIYHELFHMSSSIYTDDYKECFSGFMHMVKCGEEYFYGEGIDEGYTEYLVKKYFNNNEPTECYYCESIYAELIEKLIGEKKMENLYFTANHKGLIDELCKYALSSEVFMFYHNMDFLVHESDYLVNKNNIINRINMFVINAYSNKLQQQFLEDKISEDEYKREFDFVINKLNEINDVNKYQKKRKRGK